MRTNRVFKDIHVLYRVVVYYITLASVVVIDRLFIGEFRIVKIFSCG